jgi:UDP-N-acetylmuramyl tripeptide synthase
MDDPQRGSRGLGAEADIRHCPLCHAFLKYSRAYLGHLGHFRCPACGFSRPKPGLSARSVKPRSLDLQEVEIVSGRARAWYTLRQPGDHAAYNLLGALALLGALGFDPLSFVEYCAGFTPPYGRFERFKVDGHPLTLILFKNPAGANVLFRMVAELVKDGRYLFLLNDLSADGRDVSWIYDADFELLAAGSRGAVTAGRRAAALALRLVHAGFPEKNIRIIPAPGAALDAALADLPRKAGLHVFATYTAMHELRRVLTARTGTHAFWEEK